MTAETSLKDQIKKLIELQKLDEEAYNFNKELEEKPAFLEDLKEQFETKKAHLKQLEEKLKQDLVFRKDKELELKQKEGESAKANADLSAIKTNKEYTAKLTQIESIKADQSILEEKILESFEKTDQINKQIEEEKARVAEEEKAYLTSKKEIDEAIRQIQDRLVVLESQKKQIEPTIDGNLLAKYKKIIEHKEGIAIVPVNGTTCGGCFMNVTAQQINAIKIGTELVPCEFCTRFLYMEDAL